MEQDSFAFGDDTGGKADPAYDWDWWDVWPEGLSHQARLLLQLKRDLRAVGEATYDEEREFFKQRIAAYTKAYNANKAAAAPQGPSPRNATA